MNTYARFVYRLLPVAVVVAMAASGGTGCGGGGAPEDENGAVDTQEGTDELVGDTALMTDAVDDNAVPGDAWDVEQVDVDPDAGDGQIASCDVCEGGRVCVAGECQCPESLVDCNGECVEPGSGGADETCNGLDDNCDGTTDEGTVAGQPCDGGDVDTCQEGVWICFTGGEACSDTTDDTLEMCNAADDNCDGQTDEDTAAGQPCDGDDNDLCLEGVIACQPDGTETCTDTTEGTPEVCNGLDDDCDGQTDVFTEGCDSVVDFDLCADGTWKCITIMEDSYYGYCDDDAATLFETCGNGIDEDCDGQTDEGRGYYVDYTNRGTFTAQYVEEGFSIVSGSANLNVLQMNGIGVVGGTEDNTVDPGEQVIFEFAPAATRAVLVPQFGQSASITGWGTSENLLGTQSATAVPIDVTALFGGAALNQFMYEPVGGADRLSGVFFEVHCP